MHKTADSSSKDELRECEERKIYLEICGQVQQKAAEDLQRTQQQYDEFMQSKYSHLSLGIDA